MLNIAEQLGIRNARRNGLRPYRTRNNSRGSSAEETAAGQCRRLAGHGPVSITGRRPEPGVMVGAIRQLHSLKRLIQTEPHLIHILLKPDVKNSEQHVIGLPIGRRSHCEEFVGAVLALQSSLQ
jgi:hypothetical protein